MSKAKVVIAAGGTGGHMFPAQALARDLQKKGVEVLFLGAKLDTNKYFHKTLFPYQTVASASFSSKSPLKILRPITSLCRGVFQSLKEIWRFRPDLVIGFGSFHSAPVLIAAFIKRAPFFLFESNAWPGKVNRLFSPFADLSVVQFSETSSFLKGKSCQASVPLWHMNDSAIPSKEAALAYYGLPLGQPTLLVFGGSQGARSINSAAIDLMKVAADCGRHLQIIHLVGDASSVSEYEEVYKSLSIAYSVKAFEDKMVNAWIAADFAICRAGAATIAELLRFEVPSILIPYPKAAEDHQFLNAKVLTKMGIALCIKESELNFHVLYKALEKMLDVASYQTMKETLASANKVAGAQHLIDLVEGFIENKNKSVYG